jgi:PAS domain S-box-containing protein
VHLARVSALVTAINKEIVRVEDAHQLFVRACRIAVERGEYRFAWVGVMNPATRRIEPAARFGHEDGYLEDIRIDLDDEALSSGPVGTAFQTGTLHVVNDIASDPAMLPWRDKALRRGFGACAAFALRRAGRVIGVLAIYSGEASPFDAPSVEMLHGLADDMSFALDMLDREERRREAEAAVRVSEERYRTLVEQASDGIFLADPERRFVDVNTAGHKMLGYTREELLQLGVADLHEPEDLRAHPLELRRLPRGLAHTVERRMRRKDGTLFDAEITGKVLPDGREQAFVRDITERKAMQAQLVLAERMASLGRLAAGVAHEVNNPLAYVLLNLEVASATVAQLPAGRERDELARALEEAREGSDRVRRIVRALNAFGRGDDEPLGGVDVHAALDAAADIGESRYRHRARLVKEYGATRLAHANEFRLGQVLVNLVVNAADAIAEGDQEHNAIRLRTCDTPDGRVAIDVVDTGSGVAPEVRPRIFDPFFTTKPIGAGSGLGLSICHGIVTGFGGEIALVDTSERGSTFRVVLPAGVARPAPRVAAAAPRAQPVARARVLVVDDEPSVTGVVARALDAHEVTTCDSGARALALCVAGEPDVILCDVTMPDFDGIDLWEALRRDGRGLERRVVFMTGGTFTQRARDFLARVPNRCLEKPFAISQLEAVIDDVLSAEAG